MLPVLDYANCFYLSGGRYPFRGWVILPRKEYATISGYSTDYRLTISDPRRVGSLQPLRGLSIVQSQCVTAGLASDPNSLHLIELTDVRGLLYNEWFKAPLTAQYNIRAPAYPQTFHPQSINGGTTWTWSTMLGDIWAKCNTAVGGALGAFPGLPTTPLGTPENFWFPGVPAWRALNDVLDLLGLTVAADLTSATPFTIVSAGAADTAFTALQAKWATNLEDDLQWIDVGAGRVPGTVVVLFRRRNSIYGTEETVRYDTPTWDQSAYYSVSVSAPVFFTGAVGTHLLWDDFTVRYDMDGVADPTDTAQAALVAAERVTQYFAKIYRQTAGVLTQTYAGALPFKTGSLVDGVMWWMDPDIDDGYGGWRTKITRGSLPPFDGVWEPARP